MQIYTVNKVLLNLIEIVMYVMCISVYFNMFYTDHEIIDSIN